MKIEFELADDMRRELKDATARELENACEELEDEIAALAALPAADIKNYHGVWVLAGEDETEEDTEAYVVTADDKEKLLDELYELLEEAEHEHCLRLRGEMELQQIADEENEMRHHYEV